MKSPMLDQDQIQHFKNNGYLTGIPIVDEAGSGRYRQQFDELEKVEGKENSQIGLQGRHGDVEFIWDLASNPKILDCIEALLGPDILLLASHCFCKYGDGEKSSKFVAWHQDATYWGLKPPVTITAWYAIDDSNQENGCMRCIPGSHKAGLRSHGKSLQKGNLLSINQEVEVSEAEEEKAVDLVLKAGEISLHDGIIIHGSLPNQSSHRRCGLTLRYVPSFVRNVAKNSLGKKWGAVLMRGEAREDHFKIKENPF